MSTNRSDARESLSRRWALRAAFGMLILGLVAGGWLLFTHGSVAAQQAAEPLVERPVGTRALANHVAPESGRALPVPSLAAAPTPVQASAPAAPLIIPDGREIAPESKPASGATVSTLKLRYAHDAVFTTPTGQRFLVRFTSFHDEPRYGVRATIHPRVSGGWSATPAATAELFEWQPLVDGRRKYEQSRSVETLVFPDRSSLGWSYGGDDKGWFYNGQNRFQVVELEAPVAGEVSF